jgi:hypothetical protein
VTDLAASDQIQIFIILFQMYGGKIGAMNCRTGTD